MCLNGEEREKLLPLVILSSFQSTYICITPPDFSPRSGSGLGTRLCVGMYKLSKPFLYFALSLLNDSGPSVNTSFDTERCACPQPAALPISFTQCTCTHITPSTYVYTSFISDLILEFDLECHPSCSLDLFRSRQWAHLLLPGFCHHGLDPLFGQGSSKT